MKVKKGLEKEYKKYVKMNSNDGYSSAIVKAGKVVGKALDNGKTPEEAMKLTYKLDLTGFMAGCLARTIVYFHPKGKEFKKWWNKDSGGTGKEKGVINPAILTLRN